MSDAGEFRSAPPRSAQAGERTAPEYDLFISYVRRDVRRSVSGKTVDIVAHLKSELERHRRPSDIAGTHRRFHVCTDIDDFALDETFDKVMRDRIGRSRCFLLVASPGIATSKFVERELDIVKDLRLPRIAAVLGASPESVAPGMFDPDVVAADLDQPERTALADWRRGVRRESHKIVARVWGLDARVVFDRFEAERRKIQRNIVLAATAVLLCFAALTVGLAAQPGYHRSVELALSQRVVSPAGVGFRDSGTPIMVGGRRAFVWSGGATTEPQAFDLPFAALHAIPAGPNRVVVSSLAEIALLEFPSGTVRWKRILSAQIEALAFHAGTIAASMKGGDLAFLDADGVVTAAPRPVSQMGRRFPAFRETGPYQYGEILALNDKYLAAASLSGRLGILDRRKQTFIVAAKPQFPLAEPVERTDDPILYETENTRPIAALAFLHNGDLMFGEGAGLRLVHPATGELVVLSHCPIELVRHILPLADGLTIVALTTSTLEVLRFDPDHGDRLECLQRTALAPKSIPRAALAEDGRTVLIAFFDNRPELWKPAIKMFGLLLPLLW